MGLGAEPTWGHGLDSCCAHIMPEFGCGYASASGANSIKLQLTLCARQQVRIRPQIGFFEFFRRLWGLYGGLGAKQTGFKDFVGFGQKFGKTN
ncbi:hypothetical protein FDJ20_gp111 [Vibrio phage Thalassa]|uniref:Uncharacterized protein n=1 Tax=Vibrio phage Thalassa TaxID=2570301 RepID=A0A2H5BHA7_9CAUD|nr:hypothetical protein FDJ20_gp111 [Vibrio phage Thalassa]AUG85391.1 hypothetical protein THALASSA_212 [Vibrio phage Thalassa]